MKRALLIFGIIGLLFCHFYLPRIITQIDHPLISIFRKERGSEISYEKDGVKGESISFNSFDNTKISGFLCHSALPETKATVLLLHGIRSDRNSYLALSKELSQLGYATVAIDLRAHGKSGGTHCTFGVKEKKDISMLIDLLEEVHGVTKVGVWGRSLGGAVALQAMAVDARIQFGIVESSFSSFNQICQDYMGYYLGMSNRLFSNYLVARAGAIADFDPKKSDPYTSCASIQQPILIVHGDMDERISFHYGESNYKNLGSDYKRFILLEGGNHSNIWEKGGNEYFNSIYDFLEKNVLVK